MVLSTRRYRFLTRLLAESLLVSLMLGTVGWGLSWARNQVLRKVAADERAAAAQERIAVILEERP